MTTITETGHRLNHVEMVYRPGERGLAGRIFELLGMRVLDRGGTWMTALVDPDVADFSNNACYASEVTPEQWALEQSLAAALASDDADADGVGPAAVRTSTACAPSRSDRSTSASASSHVTTSTRPSTACAPRPPIPSSPDASRSPGCSIPTNRAQLRPT